MLRTFALAALLPGLLACTPGAPKSLTQVDELPAIRTGTYAWSDERVSAPKESRPAGDEELMAEVRRLVDTRLQERGLERVDDEGDAGVFMAARLDTTIAVRQFDPYFSVASQERFERGHLTLALQTPGNRETVWLAVDTQELRVTERAMTRESTKWTPVEEEREWDLAPLVDSVLSELPPVER